jgi:hypothetical protein
VIEPEHTKSDLPQLDRENDPRGGAIAWALLTVAAVLIIGIILVMIWTHKF